MDADSPNAAGCCPTKEGVSRWRPASAGMGSGEWRVLSDPGAERGSGEGAGERYDPTVQPEGSCAHLLSREEAMDQGRLCGGAEDRGREACGDGRQTSVRLSRADDGSED